MNQKWLKLRVKDHDEAVAIGRALTRPDVRAFVVVVGTLDQLPTDRARSRVLNFVLDKLDAEQVPDGG